MGIIFSDRLEIRNFAFLDRDDLYDLLTSKCLFCYERLEYYTKSAVKDLISRVKDSDNFLAVYNQKEGKVIGLLKLEEQQNRTVKLWIAIRKRFQGKGYASEAFNTIIKHLFTNTDTRKIVCFTDSKNLPCIKLIESLKFRKEGIFIEDNYLSLDENGLPIWRDTYSYAMLKSEWHEYNFQKNPLPQKPSCFSELESERLKTLFDAVYNSFNSIYKDFLKLNIFRRQNLQTDIMKYANTTFEAAVIQFNNYKNKLNELLDDNKSKDFQDMLENLSKMKKYYKMNYENAQNIKNSYESNTLMDFYLTRIREINDFITLADKSFLEKSLLNSTAI